MKAIKDCECKVRIFHHPHFDDYTWAFEGNGISVWATNSFRTESGCKRNWERFAKINGIKKWKYT